MATKTAEYRLVGHCSPGAIHKPRLLLVGNPNVGKSVIFSYLTGKYATVSNYPGTTVEVSRGGMRYGGRNWEVIDTPGINSLVPQSEDERVTHDLVLETQPDVVVQVADAKNLRRTLLLTTQLAELGVPMLLVLNMMDEARNRRIEIDIEGVSRMFRIPVVPTVATEGEGLYSVFKTLCRASVPHDPLKEARDGLLSPDQRALAVQLEELRNTFLDREVPPLRKVLPGLFVDPQAGNTLRLAVGFLLLGLAVFVYTEIGRLFGFELLTPYGFVNSWVEQTLIPAAQSFLSVRHVGVLGALLFGRLAEGGISYESGLLFPAITQLLLVIAPVMVPLAIILRRSQRFAERFGRWSRDWKPGLPVLFIVLLLMYEFVGVIGAGTLVDALENNVFRTVLTPLLQSVIPSGLVSDLFVGKYGLVSVGLTYALAIVLPIVLTFFIGFGLLEDSGYLPRLAILSDRILRIMGLNGKAVLPMVLGLGCDTMATMTTRILATRKERLIATLLLALGVPCSAQLGVILGISSSLSLGATLTVFGVVLSQIMLVGFLASKIVKGERSDFIFEIPPIRMPILTNVWMKTRHRLKWYLREALPLFLLGTLILFLLDRLRLPTPWGRMSGLELIETAFSPLVTGFLHLPRDTAHVFILGFLRRDYGAAGLFQMVRSGMMNSVQIVTAMIVLTLFIPCIANFFMIIREQGTRKALYILAFITPFAIVVGGAVGWILRALHIHF